MEVKFTGHALHKMAERRIQPDWVARTLDQPEYIQPDPSQPRAVRAYRRIPEFADHWLRAVYVDRSGVRVVVTVTWDRNAGRRR
jgi:hypothetical protein